MLEEIIALMEAAGLPTSRLVDVALFGPVLLFGVTLVIYLVSSAYRTRRIKHEKTARGIMAGARRRGSSVSREEMLERLRPAEEPASGPRQMMMTISEALLRLVNFNKGETQKKLVQAGMRDRRALSRYIMQRATGMLLGPVIGWLLAPMLGFGGLIQVIVALIGVFVGGVLVDMRLDRQVSAQRARISNELPVLLDLLTIYLEAGSAFDIALARASNSLKVSFPTAAGEILYLRNDLEMSIDRERTLRDFASRLDTSTARTFVAIIVQSERRGNAIAPSLRQLARDARREVFAAIEKKAQKIPTMMQLPMFLFILPAIFASVIGPAAVQIIERFSGGGF